MKEIPLYNKRQPELVAIVDDEDFERVNQYRWHVLRNKSQCYASRAVVRVDGKRREQLLHRFLLNVTDPKVNVDHQDGDGLHCWRSNIRIATSQQNNQNRKLMSNNTAGFRGVSWHGKAGKFRAVISIDGKHTHLGYFDTPEAASDAYEAKAKELYGEFYRKPPT